MTTPESIKLNQRLENFGVIPVVSLPSVDAALKLADILLKCDLPVIEITFRTPHGAKGLAEIKKHYPQIELLAGTILTKEQVDIAKDAGATAIVSPGSSPVLASYCKETKQIFMPGVCTPSEVQTALELGYNSLKFFPAEDMGGTKKLSLFNALYSDVKFMPTGGITIDNLLEYLNLDNVICCGGTWLCPEKMMAEGDWQEIENRVKAAVQLVKKRNS